MDRFLRTALLVAPLCLFQAAGAHAQALEGMDVFGVSDASAAELERCFGKEAREVVAAFTGRNPRARELEKDLERKIAQGGSFERVDIEIVHYFDPDHRIFLTFNLSPQGKSPEYLPEPQEDVPDSGGLLASWREYEKIGNTVGFDTESDLPPRCPAHHCIHGFEHPKLRPFADIFGREVPAKRTELVKILQTDKHPEDRAAAAYLLAHLPGAQQVVEALLPRLRDPEAIVRNSILRVLVYIAERGSGSIPVEPILPFLSSDATTDRNKAVAIVAALAAETRFHARLIERGACDLVRLLEMKQPNQSEFAHRALVKLRGTDLSSSDPSAWRQWLQTRGVVCRPEMEIGLGKLCPLPSVRDLSPRPGGVLRPRLSPWHSPCYLSSGRGTDAATHPQ